MLLKTKEKENMVRKQCILLPNEFQTTELESCLGVDVGVVTILETSDTHVLLTRRAKHMRTFPGLLGES